MKTYVRAVHNRSMAGDTDNPELANLYPVGAPGGSQFSGHADGVSRDIGMFGSAGSADFEGASCHHRCRRRGPYSGPNLPSTPPGNYQPTGAPQDAPNEPDNRRPGRRTRLRDHSDVLRHHTRCPGWESNPHLTVFEAALSAGWSTGAQLAAAGSSTMTIYLVTVGSGA